MGIFSGRPGSFYTTHSDEQVIVIHEAYFIILFYSRCFLDLSSSMLACLIMNQSHSYRLEVFQTFLTSTLRSAVELHSPVTEVRHEVGLILCRL